MSNLFKIFVFLTIFCMVSSILNIDSFAVDEATNKTEISTLVETKNEQNIKNYTNHVKQDSNQLEHNVIIQQIDELEEQIVKDITNYNAMTIELGIGISLAVVFFFWQWRIRYMRRRSAKKSLNNNLAKLKEKITSFKEDLQKYYDSPTIEDSLNDIITKKEKWNPILISVSNQISMSSDTMNPKIVENIEKIIKLSNIDITLDKIHDIENCDNLINHIDNLLNNDLEEEFGIFKKISVKQ